jgi:hypothetical protein
MELLLLILIIAFCFGGKGEQRARTYIKSPPKTPRPENVNPIPHSFKKDSTNGTESKR